LTWETACLCSADKSGAEKLEIITEIDRPDAPAR
jgi:hypothetical protein